MGTRRCGRDRADVEWIFRDAHDVTRRVVADECVVVEHFRVGAGARARERDDARERGERAGRTEAIARHGAARSAAGGWRGVGDARTKALGLNDNALVGGEVRAKLGALLENAATRGAALGVAGLGGFLVRPNLGDVGVEGGAEGLQVVDG